MGWQSTANFKIDARPLSRSRTSFLARHVTLSSSSNIFGERLVSCDRSFLLPGLRGASIDEFRNSASSVLSVAT